ncbi:DUF106 domain-containing protein [Halobacteriales archaeon Cl-PHB]
MPRTEQKVDELAAEGEEMTDALVAVLQVADEQGTVTWGDVSDELTSGQWGRLIEKGLLTDAGGEGFVVDDPDGVREALDEADPAASDDEADASWTTYDKLAGLGVLGLFLGYSMKSIRAQIGGLLDIILGPIEAQLPFYIMVMVLALLTGIWSTILQDNLMNMDVMSDYQEKNKELRERRKQAKERGDDEELKKIQKEQMEMMSENAGMFKAQFRPMVWIMLFTIPMFLWLYWMILDGHLEAATSPVMVLPLVGEVEGWQTGVLGPIQLWLVWYFVCSMSFTQIMRKALNVQTSPT